jgi:hypothetical protein
VDLLLRLNQLDQTGNRVFAAEDVRHALPYIVIRSGTGLADASDELLNACADVADLAGVELSMDSETVTAAFETYFRQHPIAPALRQAIDDALMPAQTRGPQAQLGHQPITGVLGGGMRPPGTTSGGLARLATLPMTPPKQETR